MKVLEKSLTSVDENPGGFVDPFKEVTGPFGTLEVKSIWVVDRVGSWRWLGPETYCSRI